MKKNGKYCSNKGMSMKPLAILLALTLLVGCAVGGTIAWLTAQTGPVTNTFTIGDINIDLKEHDLIVDQTGDYDLGDTEGTGITNYNFVPGDTLPKDPFVKVQEGSEKCYVFIKVTESNNISVTKPDNTTEDAMQYDVDETVWTPVTGHAGYWYKVVEKQNDDNDGTVEFQTFNILVDNEVKVSPYLTKNSALETAKFNLSFKAAAIQFDNIDDVADAWSNLPTEFTT